MFELYQIPKENAGVDFDVFILDVLVGGGAMTRVFFRKIKGDRVELLTQDDLQHRFDVGKQLPQSTVTLDVTGEFAETELVAKVLRRGVQFSHFDLLFEAEKRRIERRRERIEYLEKVVKRYCNKKK